jgi:hypothetical protein
MTAPLIDYFPTPAWTVAQFLESVSLPGGFWLEPAYGDGAIVRAVNKIRDDVVWMTNDVQPGALLQESYPDLEGPLLGSQCFDVCLTNPPFSLALLFAGQAMRDAHQTALLLRLNWLSPKVDRSGFLRATKPALWVLPNRPGFLPPTEDGRRKSTDTHEYAWFCWNCGGEAGSYQLLPHWDIEKRRAWDE